MERIDSKTVMKVGMRGYKETINVNWHGVIITVKTLLSREEEIQLIHNIIRCCYLEEKEMILPEFLDLSIRANIVSAYTNIDLPDDIDMQHQLLYYSTIYDVVTSNANEAQIVAVINSVTRYLNAWWSK